MASDPDRIEREIERSRARLADTIDSIADQVSPRRVANRGLGKAKAALESARRSVSARVSSLKELPAGASSQDSQVPTDQSHPRTDWTAVGTGGGATGRVRALGGRAGGLSSRAGGFSSRAAGLASQASGIATRARSRLRSSGSHAGQSVLPGGPVPLGAAVAAAVALVLILLRRRRRR